MKLVGPDVIIQSVAPLVATSENSICVVFKVVFITFVNADNSVAIDIDFPFRTTG